MPIIFCPYYDPEELYFDDITTLSKQIQCLNRSAIVERKVGGAKGNFTPLEVLVGEDEESSQVILRPRKEKLNIKDLSFHGRGEYKIELVGCMEGGVWFYINTNSGQISYLLKFSPNERNPI